MGDSSAPPGCVAASLAPQIFAPEAGAGIARDKSHDAQSSEAGEGSSPTACEEDSHRQATIVYAGAEHLFRWPRAAGAKEFGVALRDFVRGTTGLPSLAGLTLFAPGCKKVTPRDIFEGRAGHATIEAAAGAAVAPTAGLALAPPTAKGPVAAKAVSGLLAPPKPVPADNPAGRFAKKGGSQLEFFNIVSGNKNPAALLPPGTVLTRQEVMKHRTVSNCWTIYQGWVYDVTLYMDYHPGGKEELMKGAGKDCTDMFLKAHHWVSADGILGPCRLGKLVGRSPAPNRLAPPNAPVAPAQPEVGDKPDEDAKG